MSDMDFLASEIASILGKSQSDGSDAPSDASSASQDVSSPAPASTSSVEEMIDSLISQDATSGDTSPVEAPPAPQEEVSPEKASAAGKLASSFSAVAAAKESSSAAVSSPDAAAVPVETPPAPTPASAPIKENSPIRDAFSSAGRSLFDGEPDVEEEEEEEDTSARKKQSFSFCDKCGDILPCKCSRYNRHDFSGVIVTLITSWISWLFLDYVTITDGNPFTCAETFVAFCTKQDFTLLISDYRYIFPLVALIVNLLIILFVVINKPRPIRWIDLIAKIAIVVVSIIAIGNPAALLQNWADNGFMLGGTVWWIATTVMNFICGFTYKRGRLINNTIRKYR